MSELQHTLRELHRELGEARSLAPNERELLETVLGDIWAGTYPVLPLAVLASVGGSLQSGAGAGLRALGAAAAAGGTSD